MWFDILVPILLVGCGSLIPVIIWHFTRKRRFSWAYHVVLYITFFLSLSTVILFPIDLSMAVTAENQGEGDSFFSPDWLVQIWKVFYWLIQALAWLIIPIQQSFAEAGQFTFWRRVRAAIKENVILYIVMGGVLILCLIVIAVKSQFTGARTVAFSMAMSNVFGLAILIFLLGYGLVEIPRSLWNGSHREMRLSYLEFQAVKLNSQLENCMEEIVELIAAARYVDSHVSQTDPLRKHVDAILDSCGEHLEKIGRTFSEDADISYNYLVSLHRRIKKATILYTKTEAMFEQLQDEAFFLEDIIDCESNGATSIKSHFRPARTGPFARLRDSFEHWYYVKAHPWVLRVSAVLLGVLSAIVIYSEFSIVAYGPTDLPSASVFSQLVYANATEFGHWSVIVLGMGYIASCSYYSLFRMKIFATYTLVPSVSDPASMLFCALSFCRIIPSMCYNFITLVNPLTPTGFTSVMGQMNMFDVAPWFNKTFPVTLFAFSMANVFNLYSKVLKAFKIRRFSFEERYTDQQIEEGREILQKRRSYKEQQLRRPGGSTSGDPFADSAARRYLEGQSSRRAASPTSETALRNSSTLPIRNERPSKTPSSSQLDSRPPTKSSSVGKLELKPSRNNGSLGKPDSRPGIVWSEEKKAAPAAKPGKTLFGRRRNEDDDDNSLL